MVSALGLFLKLCIIKFYMITLTFVLFMAELTTKAWGWEVIYLSEVSVNGGKTMNSDYS